ncbi:hypothetical protein SAMN05428957_10753 [Oryzisolibacter propanilivorax]|uniref:Uncharacterized protein n=1 Tax=Oryzisolibacter propanilivorax TaxID=1527607 RepID=A0A1G9TXD6_9BURK|nr:hypothetical protein [Oryzisolibacter propanilivorax]SDM52347.1 hypothetical protein SAMN05428957_10753 [Oryzisolibacter propanilivorax]
MQIRYRWFRIQLPARSRDFAAIVANCPFEPGSTYGFARAPSGGAFYRYLWRSRVVVTKLNSEGAPTYEQIDSVSFIDFAVVELGNLIFLRIENAGRNIRDLLNALETLVGIGFTAKPVTFDKERPSSVFNSVDSSRLIGLKVVGAVLADDLVARMEFVSKEGMVVEKMDVLSGLKYKVDLAVFELVLSGLRGQIAFAANGSVKISGQIAPKLISLVEQDLPLLI